MKENIAKGAAEKQLMAHEKERKQLDMLKKLMSIGRPIRPSPKRSRQKSTWS